MTNVNLLPQLAVTLDASGAGGFYVSNAGDWRDVITFHQPAPNQNLPLDITGIEFAVRLNRVAGDGLPLVAATTQGGQLVNGGPAGTLTLAVPLVSVDPSAPGTRRLVAGPAVVDVIAYGDGETIDLCQVSGPLPATIRQGA